MSNGANSLGKALFLMAAVLLLSAPMAQAGKFDIGTQPAVLTGSVESGQEVVFSIQNTAKTATLKAKCSTASAEGTVQGQTIEEGTVTATYGTGKGEFSEAQGCTFGGIKSQIIMNGCKFTITGAGQPEKTSLMDIVGCTSGKQIETKVAAGGCAFKVGEQNGLSHIVGKDLTAKEGTTEATITSVRVQQAGGATCPDGGTAHTGTSGALTFNTVLKAFKDNGTAVVTKHGHQYTEHICGEQVAVQVT